MEFGSSAIAYQQDKGGHQFFDYEYLVSLFL